MPYNINFVYSPHHNIGTHFFIWTLYFLSGQKNHWAQGKQMPVCQEIDISNNKNFHAIQPSDLLRGVEDWTSISRQLTHIDRDLLPLHLFLTHHKLSDIAEKTFRTRLETLAPDQITYLQQLRQQQSCDFVRSLQSTGYHVIQLDWHGQDFLTAFFNDRYVLDWNACPWSSKQDFLDFYLDTFFHDTRHKFDVNLWDKREHLALTIGPLIENICYKNILDISRPHLYYTSDDLWNLLDTCLIEIFQFLDLKLDKSKLDTWTNIYNCWRKFHKMGFARNIDRIVDAIVQGEFMDLTRYQLGFFEEVLVQHNLIFKHGLNIKNWQLNKFPTNTQDLHRLLEPSTHKL